MSRQQGKVVSVRVHTILIKNKSDAHAFTTLLLAQTVSVRILHVTGLIGEDGWHVGTMDVKTNAAIGDQNICTFGAQFNSILSTCIN